MLTAMQRISNSSDPLKLHYTAMSYKPFLSFFNMTGIVESGQVDGGIGETPSWHDTRLQADLGIRS